MSARNIPSLQNLSLKRVFEDTFLHATKFRGDSTNYEKFQGIFADNIVEMFHEKFAYSSAEEISPENEGYMRLLRQFSDFIFNENVKTIRVPYRGYSPEIIAAIGRNCKNLKSLQSIGRNLDPMVYNPILRDMKNLTVLNLSLYKNLNVETIEVIAISLTELKTLSLIFTNINDDALFILCGHKRCDGEDIRSCCYTKECGMSSPLQLRKLDISGTEASNAGVACVLTHMPTLQNLNPPSSGDVPNAFCEIDKQRKTGGMSRLNVQLTSLDCGEFDGDLETVIGSSPELEELVLCISNENNNRRDQTQAMCRLNHLKSISLSSGSSDRLSESMKMFWTSNGSHIKSLHFFREMGENMLFDTKDLEYILRMCPYLEKLYLADIYLNCPISGNKPFRHVLCLSNLHKLKIRMEGEPHSMVVREVFKIISEAINIKKLTLHLPADVNVVSELLSEIELLSLKKITYIDSNQTDGTYTWRY